MVEAVALTDIKSAVCPALFEMLLTPNYSDVEPDPEYVEKMLEMILEHPYNIMIMDRSSTGAVRGVMIGMCTPCWYTASLRATQEFMYVYPEHRNSTVPMRLLRAFEQRAVELGADSIVLGMSSGEDTTSFEKLMIRMKYSTFSKTFKKEL